jgi:hypothetical protein
VNRKKESKNKQANNNTFSSSTIGFFSENQLILL